MKVYVVINVPEYEPSNIISIWTTEAQAVSAIESATASEGAFITADYAIQAYDVGEGEQPDGL